MTSGFFYIENNGFSWMLLEGAENGHDDHHHENPEFVNGHFLKKELIGTSAGTRNYKPGKLSSFYSNYFLGNDPSRWKSEIYSTHSLDISGQYPGITTRYYGTDDGFLKYDILVSAGANAEDVKWKYAGAAKTEIRNGELIITTPLGTMTEKKPVVWQMVNGVKRIVRCNYKIAGEEVSFHFPDGYDSAYELVIDPVLVFSSFTGSTADNFGFTATYDIQKNTFAAGIVFGFGLYPVTPGAFQSTFSGLVDVGLTKFNTTGSGLVYSTYLGGSDTDAPHSLVCNNAGELYVMGTTGSFNFPVINAYDGIFSGGVPAAPPSSGTNYSNGSDIFVAKFNAGGSALLGSTFVGGTGNDGLNLAGTLTFNYGDPFRGEIIVEATGTVVVASVTSSADFPVSGNAPEPVFGGGFSDAVVFRLSAGLNTLMWSTYFGGSGADSGYGVQIDTNGDVYATGGTESVDLLASPGALDVTYNGLVDGYIVRYSANGNSILACTYIGTAAYDQTYFVQLDNNNFVYVIGQTAGAYPITPASVYNNGNSGQFIHKLNNALTTTQFSTRIGRNAGTVDFSPSAFLVNNCGQIYISGWGGPLNGIFPYQGAASSTMNLPVTADAIQSTTDGSDFYLMILAPDATALLFGTYFGGSAPGSNEHVDGGTSRFDKDGVVYQAVCGGCGGTSNFPTTPGAWSNTNNSTNCNLVVFKIDLKEIIANALFSLVSNNCQIPATVNFTNQSVGAISYYWDFGDGTNSVAVNPTHTYAASGTYNVILIALDSNTCNAVDTANMTVFIPAPLSITISPSDTICIGGQASLTANGALNYTWTPAGTLIDPNTSTPTASPGSSTTYTVIATDVNGCIDTATVYVHVLANVSADFTNSFTPCTIPLDVSFLNQSQGGVNYFWDFGNGFTSVNPDDLITYTAPGTYTITLVAIDSNSCNFSDTAVQVIFIPPPANVSVTPGDTICTGTSLPATASGGDTYIWIPSNTVSNPTSPSPILSPGSTTDYLVIGTDTNGCSDTALLTVHVFPPASIDAGPDIILDVGDAPILNPSIPGNGIFYWTPSTGLSCTNCPNPTAIPETNTWYYLYYIDNYGCTYVDSMLVLVTPSVFVPNAFTPNGDPMNDYFQPVVRNLSYYEFYIFDRWGELIFHSTDSNEGWDGRYEGLNCPIGVYVWKIRYSDYITPDEVREKIGHVTIVR
jgi:gliding motility-associated-like protein